MLRSVDFGAMFAALPAVETPIANNQAHRTGYTAEGIRVVLSRQAWGDPSLVKMARDFFWHHPTVNILIPQIVILQNEAAHSIARHARERSVFGVDRSGDHAKARSGVLRCCPNWLQG
jgi:hypothetical protein